MPKHFYLCGFGNAEVHFRSKFIFQFVSISTLFRCKMQAVDNIASFSSDLDFLGLNLKLLNILNNSMKVSQISTHPHALPQHTHPYKMLLQCLKPIKRGKSDRFWASNVFYGKYPGKAESRGKSSSKGQ